MHRFRLRGAAVIASALAAVLLGAGSASAAAWPDGAWSGNGTATTTVTSDGATNNPVFDYSTSGRTGNWTFSATAKTARTQPIVWRYKGYHAWFQVRVGLKQFVIRNGQETETDLRSEGPVNCCSAPSGGFDYTGTATFDLRPGDTYGFKMSGSNADSDRRLIGTLSLSPPVTPISVVNPGSQTGKVGTVASLAMLAAYGTTPYTWSATGLPAGLSINSSTGVISGTPTTAGASNVTVSVTDATAPTRTTASTTFTWNVSPTVACSSSGQKIANPGFDNIGTEPWTTGMPNVIGSFAGQTARSGIRMAWLGGYGVPHIDTLMQRVTVPAGCTNYTLTFWTHIDSAETSTTTAVDKLTVQLGSTTLASFSNRDQGAGYVQRSYNVSAFAGQTVTLQFTAAENLSLQTSFVIDDVELNVS